MPEHYTKNVIEASVWCNVCRKMTMHRIDKGRRGPCLDCMKNQEPRVTGDYQFSVDRKPGFMKRQRAAKQEKLFYGDELD